MIRAIDRSSVQKICSGQVVVDLATAVKELVENSLDSGATSIEVRLKEMGANCIEVSDNGSGIDPSNYSGIAVKHCTSKLHVFEDIYSVSSFGFRGEALNALCELSEKFTVITKQDAQTVGTQLEFDRNGRLVSQNVAARANGTTVIVDNLFEKLPVRRKDFVKSIKKHFQKMVRVLQSYALISVGVKIIVTNTTLAGGRQTVFATQSGGKLSDNVSILFGAKFAASLLPLSVAVTLTKSNNIEVEKEEEAPAVEEEEGEQELFEESPTGVALLAAQEVAMVENPADRGDEAQQTGSMTDRDDLAANTTAVDTAVTIASAAADVSPCVVTVRGLASKVALGVGRSDNDRQFTFVNSRPVDLPRFAKVLNEVWRRYEMKQKPAFVLDITVPPGYFDVNLTPDKREVLIVQEARILDALRECVDALYLPARQTMQLNQGMADSKLTALWPVRPAAAAQNESVSSEGAAVRGGEEDEWVEETVVHRSATQVTSEAESIPPSQLSNESPVQKPGAGTVWASPLDRERLLWSPTRRALTQDSSADSIATSSRSVNAEASKEDQQVLSVHRVTALTAEQPPAADEDVAVMYAPYVKKQTSWGFDPEDVLRRVRARTSSAPSAIADDSAPAPSAAPVSSAGAMEVAGGEEDVFTVDTPAAAIPGQDRLQARILHKKDFPRMRVVGQFNLGFIIAELEGDLYILDQHACDEKYRFEELQRTTQLHQQPLLQPLSVETSAALELVIAENLDAFVQNGFKISADLNAPVGQRVKLLSVPFSKSVRFGADDVNELASMISDRQGGERDAGDPTTERTSKAYLALKNDAVATVDTVHSRLRSSQLRLPKLVAMYASRACRSAFMIGTALKPQEMSRVVEKLENVEQPWNCPHGRPTLRHLVDLAPLREHRKRKMEAMQCT